MYKFLSQIENPYVLDYDGMLPGAQAAVYADNTLLLKVAGTGAMGKGYWKFYGIREHIQYHMRVHDLMMATIRIEVRVNDNSAILKEETIDVIYCERQVLGVEAQDFICRRFFRSSDIAFIEDGVTQPLPYLMPVPGAFWYERVWLYLDEDGVQQSTTSRTLVGNRGTLTLAMPTGISYQKMIGGTLSVFPADDKSIDQTIPSKTLQRPPSYSSLDPTRNATVLATWNTPGVFYSKVRVDIPALAPTLTAGSVLVMVSTGRKIVGRQFLTPTGDLTMSVDLGGVSQVTVSVSNSSKVTLPPVKIHLDAASVNDALRGNSPVLNVYAHAGSKIASWRFRNIFNATEVLSLPVSIESKPETESEQVVCEGVTMQYDQKTTVPHEVKFGVLQQEALEALRQLCQSWKVEYRHNGRWVPVVITKYEINDSTDVGSYNEPSLTFEFAGTAPYADMGDIKPSTLVDDYTNIIGGSTGGGSGTGGGGGNQGGGSIDPGEEEPDDFTPGQLVGTLQVTATQADDYDYDLRSSAVLGTPTSRPTDTWLRYTTNRIYCLKDSDVDLQMTVDAHCVSPSSPDYPIGSLCGVELYDADGDCIDQEYSNTYPTVDEVYTFHKQWHVPAGGYILINLVANYFVTLKQPISITMKQWACDGRYDD